MREFTLIIKTNSQELKMYIGQNIWYEKKKSVQITEEGVQFSYCTTNENYEKDFCELDEYVSRLEKHIGKNVSYEIRMKKIITVGERK